MTWIFDPKRPALMPERRGAWFGRKSLDGPSKLRTSAPQKEPGNPDDERQACNPEEES